MDNETRSSVPLPRAQLERLERDGFVVLEGLIEPSLLARLTARIDELLAAEGDAAGHEFMQESGARRLANLANKGSVFLEAALQPGVLAWVERVLGPDIKLSSLNARRVDPRSGNTQPLHTDMGALPDEHGYWVCNTVWMLDPFTAENGTLRAVPGSHRSGRLPQEVMSDPRAPHADEVLITAPAGSVVVMNAHVWHGATPNRTERSRSALHVFYCRRDKPQQQHQKALLHDAVRARLSPAERHLLALDDPRNDELSRDVARRSGFMQ